MKYIVCGFCFEQEYLNHSWQLALKQEVDVAALMEPEQDIFIQEQHSFSLPSLTSSSYSILMAKWLAACRTRTMSFEDLKAVLIHPLPTLSSNSSTITLVDELRSASSKIDSTIPKVLKPFYDPDEWLSDMDQMVHRMKEPEFSKGTYEMLDGFRQHFLEGAEGKVSYQIEPVLPLLFLSLVDQIEVAPDTPLLQTIAFRSSPYCPIFNAPDLWLQRTAFVHCIKYYGLKFALKHFIEQDGRIELLWYSVMKLNLSEPEVEKTIQTLQQNPQLYVAEYVESYIEIVRAFVEAGKQN